MTQPTATIRINTSYTTPQIGKQYARNLADALDSEFPDWNVNVIPGSADDVALPIENMQENFRTEFRVRALMTASLIQAIKDCQGDVP
jgi:predicted AlkP superfamily phosphohydrolase/phosphomutase